MDFLLYDNKFLITDGDPGQKRHEFIKNVFKRKFEIELKDEWIYYRTQKYILSLSQNDTGFSDNVEYAYKVENNDNIELPVIIAITEKNNQVINECPPEDVCDVVISPFGDYGIQEVEEKKDKHKKFIINEGLLLMVVMIRFSFDIFIHLPADKIEEYIYDWRRIFNVV